MKIEIILTIIQTILIFSGFLIAIRQLLLFGKQISSNTDQIKNQSKWQRKEATFNYLDRYRSELSECNKNLQKKIGLLKQNGESISFEQIIELLKDNKTRSELYEIVTYFEQLAIGVEEEYFDEAIIKKMQLNIVITTFHLLKPYLLFRRNETNRNIGGHFEKLVQRWELLQRS